MSIQNNTRLLVKIATLYYDEGMKQSDIAKQLNLSQSQVSRSLTQCLKNGLVKISVIHPPNVFIQLENQIQETYGLTQAIVVDVSDDANSHQIKRAIGSMAAHLIETTLRNNELVGVSSWSETIRAMVENMRPQKIQAGGVIQLLGGVGQNGNLQANILTQSLANLLNCTPYLLPAVNIERSMATKNHLLKSLEVSAVVKKFEDVDLALVGIGSMEPSLMLRNSGNYYHEKMTKELLNRGAVGDICLHYYDKTGKPVLMEDEDPVISISLDQLKNCPRVVALAGGLDKVEAIRAALKSQRINTLVTDRLTAEQLV